MRVFIAIDIPDNIKEEIYLLSKKVEGIIGKPVEKENLHITIKFIGEIEENLLEELKKILENIFYNKFYLELSGVGTFNNRVLWIGISKGFREIVELHNLIEEKLAKIRIPKDFNFHPHLTIYRIKNIEYKKNFEESIKLLKNYKSPQILVDRIYLKHSTLTYKGPIYRNIGEYKLL